MNSEKFASILGAIVAAVVLVIAFLYGPIGKPPNPGQKVEVGGAADSTAATRRPGAGGARGAAVSLQPYDRGPLQNPTAIPI